jgi:hypothetical protein
MKHATATASLLLGLLLEGANGQVVVVGADGKSGPPSATSEYCSQVEPLQPNLKLNVDTSVRGHVTDQTSEPFRNSPIELRHFISETKQVSVKKVSTDGDGNFDLRVVKRGDYRLVLSPNRGFKQPAKLECWPKDCTLYVVLIGNPTDQLAATCPIR